MLITFTSGPSKSPISAFSELETAPAHFLPPLCSFPLNFDFIFGCFLTVIVVFESFS